MLCFICLGLHYGWSTWSVIDHRPPEFYVLENLGSRLGSQPLNAFFAKNKERSPHANFPILVRIANMCHRHTNGANAVGKIAPVDSLDTGLPQTDLQSVKHVISVKCREMRYACRSLSLSRFWKDLD